MWTLCLCRFCFVAHQWARKSHALKINAHHRIYSIVSYIGRCRVHVPLFACHLIHIYWTDMYATEMVHVCIWPIMWQSCLRICLSLCLTKINVWQTNQFTSILIFIDLIESNSLWGERQFILFHFIYLRCHIFRLEYFVRADEPHTRLKRAKQHNHVDFNQWLLTLDSGQPEYLNQYTRAICHSHRKHRFQMEPTTFDY